ncbi:MAG: PKD domain-containing protein [Phycisphaerae bacterium]|nr:PKD domain-containing protein [Phycisphaerae bacterium]
MTTDRTSRLNRIRMARRAAVRVTLIALALTCPTGCPVTTSLPTESEIQDARLPAGGRYYLYVPSTYDRSRAYPLVIACHGTNPWDTAWAQIREWALFAERNDVIVAAPYLQGTRGDFRPSADQQLRKQNADEQFILDLVSALKASRNIAEEKVFMTGWSAGAFAILHTGLRHPDVFRALAIRQGTFEPSYIDVDPDRLDRWQPIFIYYGQTDPLRTEAIACTDWLRERNMFVERMELAGSHRRLDVKLAWDFFEKIVRERPWIRLRAVKTDRRNRMLVHFLCDAKPEARKWHWEFGDGETSNEQNPAHVYAAPGRYDVACTVTLKVNKAYRRTTTVQVGPPTDAR